MGTGVNTLFKALLNHPGFKSLDFSKWKVFVAGGMALELSVQKRWRSVTNSRLIEGYGLTEASPVVCCSRLDSPREGFSGFPFPSTEVRVCNDKGLELGFEQEGELEIRGPQVMEGYYRREEETRQVLNPEGWLKTGDIAKISKEGLIQILGRKKELINISGLKVYPIEVEEALLSFDGVKEAVVVPALNAEGEEAVKAFVVKDTEDLFMEELRSHCRGHLASYKIPKRIEFVKSLPKNAMGKPLRRFFKNRPL